VHSLESCNKHVDVAMMIHVTRDTLASALCDHDASNSLMSAAHHELSLTRHSALSLCYLQVVLPVLPRHQGCLSLPSCLLRSPGCLPPEGAVPDERLQRFRHREHHVRHRCRCHCRVCYLPQGPGCHHVLCLVLYALDFLPETDAVPQFLPGS